MSTAGHIRAFLSACALAALAVTVAACGAPTTPTQSAVNSDEAIEAQQSSAPPEAAPSFSMTGTYDVLGDPHNHITNGETCQGNGPDGSPIGTATPVYVFDKQGHQLAVGNLSKGTAIVNSLQTACQFTITVDGVPDGLPGYGVEVGTYGVRQVSSTAAHQGVSLIN